MHSSSGKTYAIHAAMFAATCLTTTWAGAFHAHPNISWFRLDRAIPMLSDGLAFSTSLMLILLSHEMGHYVVARLHRVEASLPLFLPLPFGLIGTLGAIIGMPRSVRDRNALADIGAAGPLAGLLVAVPLLAYGIHLSPVGPAVPGALLEGNSILYLLMKLLLKGLVLPGNGLDVHLHPVAWAGWVGLLITMINLLPVGQLDGGHIATAYFGNAHDRAARWLHHSLILLAAIAVVYAALELTNQMPRSATIQQALLAGAPWFMWWLLLNLMKKWGGGRYHPPVDNAPITPGRRRLCIALLVVFVLVLTPIPLRMAI